MEYEKRHEKSYRGWRGRGGALWKQSIAEWTATVPAEKGSASSLTLSCVYEYLLVFTGLGSDRMEAQCLTWEKQSQAREGESRSTRFLCLSFYQSSCQWPPLACPKMEGSLPRSCMVCKSALTLKQKRSGFASFLVDLLPKKGSWEHSGSAISLKSCFCARQTYKIHPPRFTFPF